MSKKTPLILSVALLGLLSAGAMWFMQRGFNGPRLGGVYMDQSMPSRGMGEVGMAVPEPAIIDKYTSSIMPVPPTYYPYPGDALDIKERAIHKYSYFTFIVTDVGEYLRSSRDYITSVGGTVLSYTQSSGEHNYFSGSIMAKVPEDRFDEVNARLTQNVKKIVAENINTEDITGQVVSTNTQKQNLEEKKAILELELEETTTAAERRRVQYEIDRVNRQIEQLTQSQQTVEERVQYATVNVTVSNKEYYFTGGGPRPFGDVLREAWHSLKNTGFGVIYFLIWAAVYAVIWIPILLLARWLWVKMRPAPASK